MCPILPEVYVAFSRSKLVAGLLISAGCVFLSGLKQTRESVIMCLMAERVHWLIVGVIFVWSLLVCCQDDEADNCDGGRPELLNVCVCVNAAITYKHVHDHINIHIHADTHSQRP